MLRMDQLSEDEIRKYLRPHSQWFNIVGPLIAILTVVGGAIWWAARSPDPARVEKIQNDVFDIRLNQATTQKDVQGLAHDQAGIRDDVSAIKVDLKQLLQRRH